MHEPHNFFLEISLQVNNTIQLKNNKCRTMKKSKCKSDKAKKVDRANNFPLFVLHYLYTKLRNVLLWNRSHAHTRRHTHAQKNIRIICIKGKKLKRTFLYPSWYLYIFIKPQMSYNHSNQSNLMHEKENESKKILSITRLFFLSDWLVLYSRGYKMKITAVYTPNVKFKSSRLQHNP